MANQEHIDILKQGTDNWNAWRAENPTIIPDLSEAYLSFIELKPGVNLSNAMMYNVALERASLIGADCDNASFFGASLFRTDCTDASFIEASLYRANLSDAKFNRANLSHTDLTGANLTRADFTSAKLYYAALGDTIFGNTKLFNIKGLETCYHAAPSIVDHLTILNSNIPILEFLKGIGWPNWQIEAARLYLPGLKPKEVDNIAHRISQLYHPTPPMSLFISYSHSDAKFVDHIEQKLDADGIRFWRDIHDAPAGPLEKSIAKAITRMGTVLLVLSKHSVKSDWVESEAKKARKLEKEGRNYVLCPVALDDSWKTCNWPDWLMDQITKYNILDFANWETDINKFEKRYAKLKEGLYQYYQDEPE